MSESMRMWVEILFNLGYLIVVWGLVVVMARRRNVLADEARRQADLVIWAFFFLALGDTGHVGFRVWAYALGGLDSELMILGRNISLVGAGMLMTAVTVTLFYELMLVLWRTRYHKNYGPFEWFLMGVGAIRLILLTFPANEWSRVVPPQPWSTIRNFPLLILGLGVAYLFIRDATRENDHYFKWAGIMVLISYACYVPVILFVAQAPMIGMLMIPKTLAYVGIGFLAYKELYNRRPLQTVSATYS